MVEFHTYNDMTDYMLDYASKNCYVVILQFCTINISVLK